MPHRVEVAGKFFRLGGEKWYVRGFSYGPFAPNDDGDWLPPHPRRLADFRHMQQLGCNAIRLYYPPARHVLDEAGEHGLRVFLDIPWDKHRCFLEDWDSQEEARRRIRQAARTLGDHPALFAMSVVNEFPNDIVRFYGHRRLERFVEELLDIVKQESPGCLATFVNFPPTEFLHPRRTDFCCFNVYLHDPRSLRAYLSRLQHVAGDAPLVLGEHGLDSLRHGERRQAKLLAAHAKGVFRQGLAGSFVFSYTDDWFTGGGQVADWGFGVTRRDRSEKPAARSLNAVWGRAPHVGAAALPKVSVVVCSYNAAATLNECLSSLMRLDYPDYEVILVDDGSTDSTPQIAAEFPQVCYLRQSNRGLGAARNVGARAARGAIVAYTDADCVADEHWLLYLVQAKLAQRVEAIGGSNIPPPSDNSIAQCVAASPGGPSHVMLDDRHAEHVPGCNMAFTREKLLALGGFDPQFRQAGDDVDICWRFLDAGWNIGYAPEARVWHHRRNTVLAYFKQQAGYGKSEAMVRCRHPQRFNRLGRSQWKGIIYGNGAVGLPLLPPLIYHGRFGSALFQAIYHRNGYSLWASVTSLEWHATAVFLAALSFVLGTFAWISLGMWLLTVLVTFGLAWRAPVPREAPWWSRPLIWGLHLAQPVVRGWNHLTHLLRCRRTVPTPDGVLSRPPAKWISATQCDLYWESDQGLGREALLDALVAAAKRGHWLGDFNNHWVQWDLKLTGDRWHDITIHTATEELGGRRRFTRARCAARRTLFGRLAVGATLIWSATALASGGEYATTIALIAATAILAAMVTSRRRCLPAAAALLATAGERAGLQRTDPGGRPISRPIDCGLRQKTSPETDVTGIMVEEATIPGE